MKAFYMRDGVPLHVTVLCRLPLRGSVWYRIRVNSAGDSLYPKGDEALVSGSLLHDRDTGKPLSAIQLSSVPTDGDGAIKKVI